MDHCEEAQQPVVERRAGCQRSWECPCCGPSRVEIEVLLVSKEQSGGGRKGRLISITDTKDGNEREGIRDSLNGTGFPVRAE